MSFRRTRRRAGYVVCQYNTQTWDWSVLNRKVRADFIWQQGNRADVSLSYIFTKQQAWPWWQGTQERGACASQLAEHKERSVYHVNIPSDGEVSPQWGRSQWFPFTWRKGAEFLLRGVGPWAEGCDGSDAEQVGCVWLQVSQSDVGLEKVLHCVTCLLSLRKSDWVKVTNAHWTKRTLPPLRVKGGRTDKAGVTFSKNMTSYSTEVRLRCRGASQETERLLSSLCVRINWDTVTGAAGGRTENVRKKYKQNAD